MIVDQHGKAPELATGPERIPSLISRINSGDIKIPAFQRSYVWKQNQIIELLDSIVNNYPIGSVLLWNTSEILNHTRNIVGIKIPETKADYPLNYVLDGQQRLSSIYAVFNDEKEQDANSADYNPDLELFNLYYDFSSKSFKPKNEINSFDEAVSLNNLLDLTKLLSIITGLKPEFHKDVQDLMEKFLNYEIPVITIKHRTKAEVGNIFERINNTGTKLGILDLMTAWTWTDEFHLLDKTKNLFEYLDKKGFGKLNKNIVLQCVSGIIQNDTTTDAITVLEGSQIRDHWDLLTESLKKSIDFLSTELNCKHLDFLPAQQMLVGICKFFSIKGKPTLAQYEVLKKWFWRVSFSNRYASGRTTSKMNDDIELMIDIRNEEYGKLDNFKVNIYNTDLILTKFAISNLVTRSFLLLLAQEHPRDLVTNVKIDIDKSLSKYNRKEYHHVFPNAYLKDQGVHPDIISSVMNFCFLPSSSNKVISDKKPSDYFFNVIDSKHLIELLNNNLLPIDLNIYKENKYREFLAGRADLIIDKVNNMI